MSKQFNAIIADQRVIFRGSSTVGISTSTMPNFRAITGAAYAVNVTGGISGSFGVMVLGQLGGITYHLAGLTSLAAGSFMMYPATYNGAGALNILETTVTVANYRGLDQLIPPQSVLFEAGGAANAIGISATIEVSAVIYAE